MKELVLIQIHSLDLERNRYMTERTWPFSFITCNESSMSHVYVRVRNRFDGRLPARTGDFSSTSSTTGADDVIYVSRKRKAT